MVAEIQTPALILFGEGALARIGEALQKIGVSRPLVVTDRGLVSTPVFEALRSALSGAAIEFGVFSDTVPIGGRTGNVVQVSGTPPGGTVKGSMAMIWQTVRYSFDSSKVFPGVSWLTQITPRSRSW